MSYDPPSYVVNYAQTRKLPFEVAIDNTGAVAKAWGDVQLTPTSFIVNKRGEIVKRYVGEPDFAELHQLIEKLLARPELTGIAPTKKPRIAGPFSFRASAPYSPCGNRRGRPCRYRRPGRRRPSGCRGCRSWRP